ncbi:MAG: hypothetical protein ABR964_06925 [Tepidisphaeraceae bacterium]|jgi:hypothetical protein
MAVELIRFLAGALVLLIPGIFLAVWLKTGRTLLDQLCHGSCLGLALACYLGSLVSHVDLRWFYPLWGAIAAVAVAGFLVSCFGRGARKRDAGQRQTQLCMAAVLVLVALTRFVPVLPHALPRGWDPSFHMILAEKIRLTHHAIDDWTPFESAKLNYPTGSHVLLVVLAAVSRLPLQTVFKDLIPLLGVLSTAQVFLFVRNVTADAAAGLYAAIAYGLWAVGGSLGYYLWGGLPNELAMLLFLAMLTIWLEQAVLPWRIAIMGLLYGGVILVHHHVMVTSAVILAVCFLWSVLSRSVSGPWKTLALAVALAVVLDAFFLIPYAARLTTLHTTRVFHGDEPFTDAATIPESFGYFFAGLAAFGIITWGLRRKAQCHFCVLCAGVVLVAFYVAAEYAIPRLLQGRGGERATAFTPSRFLSDLTYFLAVFAGLGAAIVQRLLKLPVAAAAVVLSLAAASQINVWKDLATPPDVPDEFVSACRWINRSTPATTVVFNHEPWTSYLAWRRTIFTPMPISEPIADRYVLYRRIGALLTGQTTPDDGGLDVVQILPRNDYHQQPVLWKGSELVVVRLWPR